MEQKEKKDLFEPRPVLPASTLTLAGECVVKIDR